MSENTEGTWNEEVAAYLEGQGYETELGVLIKNRETDVLARRDTVGSDDEEVIVVTCKDRDHEIRVPTVRNIKTRVDSIREIANATPALAHTSTLSESAAEAASDWNVVLITPADVREA